MTKKESWKVGSKEPKSEPTKKDKETLYMGVDMGGSHLAIHIVDGEGNKKVKISEDLTFYKYSNNKKEGELSERETEILNALEMLIASAYNQIDHNEYEINTIGFGIPGTIDGTRIINLTNIGLNNFNIGEELTKRLEKTGMSSETKIYMQNDAATAAIGELLHNKGKLKGIGGGNCTLGTGYGYDTMIYDSEYGYGYIDKGHQGGGSEGGHVCIDVNSKEVCGCGNTGCLECFASVARMREKISKLLGLEKSEIREKDQTIDGIDLEAIFNKILERPNSEHLEEQLKTGKNKTKNLQEIMESEEFAEMAAEIKSIRETWIKAIIIGAKNANANHDVSNFVIGGAGAYLLTEEDREMIEEKVNENPVKPGNLCKIQISELKGDAGAIGAALIPVYEKIIREKELTKAEAKMLEEYGLTPDEIRDAMKLAQHTKKQREGHTGK